MTMTTNDNKKKVMVDEEEKKNDEEDIHRDRREHIRSSTTTTTSTTTATGVPTFPTCTFQDGRSTMCGRAVYEQWTDEELSKEFFVCYPDLAASQYHKLDLQYLSSSSQDQKEEKERRQQERQEPSAGQIGKSSLSSSSSSSLSTKTTSSTTSTTTTMKKTIKEKKNSTTKATTTTKATASASATGSSSSSSTSSAKVKSTTGTNTNNTNTTTTNNNNINNNNKLTKTIPLPTTNRDLVVDDINKTIPFTSRSKLIDCIMIQRDLKVVVPVVPTVVQQQNDSSGSGDGGRQKKMDHDLQRRDGMDVGDDGTTTTANTTTTNTTTTTTTKNNNVNKNTNMNKNKNDNGMMVPDFLDTWCTLIGNPKMMIVSTRQPQPDGQQHQEQQHNNNDLFTNSNSTSPPPTTNTTSAGLTTDNTTGSNVDDDDDSPRRRPRPPPPQPEVNVHFWRSIHGRLVKAVDYYGGMYTIRSAYKTLSSSRSSDDDDNDDDDSDVWYNWTGRVKPGFLEISEAAEEAFATFVGTGIVDRKGQTPPPSSSSSKVVVNDTATGRPSASVPSTSSSTHSVSNPKIKSKKTSTPASTTTSASASNTTKGTTTTTTTSTTKSSTGTGTTAARTATPSGGGSDGGGGGSDDGKFGPMTMKLSPELERHYRLSQHMMKRKSSIALPSSLAPAGRKSSGSSGRRGGRLTNASSRLGDKSDKFGTKNIFLGMQMARIRIPKGKRPGDFIKIRNPYIPEYECTIKIPAGTKGKFFQHPLPVKLRTEEHSLCVVCHRDLEGNTDDAVPLRSCSMVACTTCFEYINGGSCPVCEAPLPSIDTIGCLPLLLVFGKEKTYELKDILLAEYYLLKDVENKSEDWEDSKQALEDISPQIDAHVKRLYRKKSLHLHPDRNPELVAEWELLNKAKGIFSDPKTRRKYVNDMIDFICSFQAPDAQSTLLFNEQWLEDFDRANVIMEDGLRAERRRQQRSTTRTTNDAPMKALEDGTRVGKLKRPRVSIESVKNRHIRVFVNHDRFKNYTQQVTIFGSCERLDDGKYIVLKTIGKNKFDELDDEIRVSLELPCTGVWTIGWQAKLSYMDDGSSSFDTARSTETIVDVGDSKQRQAEADAVSGLIISARRRTDALRSAEKLLGAAVDRLQIEDRYDELVRCIAKAMDVSVRLKQQADEKDHQSIPDALRTLNEALIPANEAKEKFGHKLASYPKRDKKRAFRRALLEYFATGETKTLLEEISGNDLEKLGGDANRFWQILVGAKPSERIDLSSSELSTAGNRKDLFSPKQRSILMERADVLAIQEVKEKEDFSEESISTKEDSSAEDNIVDENCNRLRSPVTDHSQGSAQEKAPAAVTMENSPIAPVLADKEVQKKDSRVDIPSVSFEAEEILSAASAVSAKISPATELTSIQTSFSPIDATQAQTTITQEGSFLCGSAGDTPYLQQTPSMLLSPLFASPQNEGSTKTFTQVQDHDHRSLIDENSEKTAADFPLAFLDRSPGIQSSRNTFEDLIGLPMPGPTTEESSSHVSGLTLDAIEVVRGDEIAFQASITMNRASNSIGKPSILSHLLEPSPADPLCDFINKQHACFKVPPDAFHKFLLSQDISTMKDLREAMEDDDFVLQDMHDGGLKLYKRKLFLREIEMSM